MAITQPALKCHEGEMAVSECVADYVDRQLGCSPRMLRSDLSVGACRGNMSEEVSKRLHDFNVMSEKELLQTTGTLIREARAHFEYELNGEISQS